MTYISHPPPPPDRIPSLEEGVSSKEWSAEELKTLYRWMQLSRAIETRAVELYRQSRITGGCYTGIGNEATSVGSAFALAEQDVLVPTHRDMGSHLVRGHSPIDIMRQYLKRNTAQTQGKDSSLHLGREGSNIVGMISHLAHMMPVAVGIALAERQKATQTGKEPICVLTTVGDGATSLGDFHEALNFAAVHKLPVVFIIVNNQYAYSTPITLQYASSKLSDRAIGYGMTGEQIDGTNVLAVLQATRKALDRGRKGEGPTLIESMTMRMRGHSEHDDFRYVPKELIEQWSRWDPLKRTASYLLEHAWVDETWLTQTHQNIESELDIAVATAERDPAPNPEAAGQDIFRKWPSDWTTPSGETWEIRS